MDRIDAMATFVAVADLKGFAAAARKLKRSAPMVTRAVASLEEHLGLRLLQRTTRSVTLTDAGRRYLDRARGILAEVEQAEAAARAERTFPSGRLVVGGPTLFGKLHVAPLVTKFLKKHPAVRAELRLQDRVVSLVDEGVDVAVRIGVLQDSSLVARKVGETSRVTVAAPGYAGSARICFSGVGRPDEGAAFTTNHGEAALAHAIAGGGIVELLSYQAAAAVAAGKLALRRTGEKLPIHCVMPSARLPSAAARAFIDAAADQNWRF